MSAPVLSFRAESGGAHVDLERLVASRLLLQANSGGGKSFMLRYILEQTHGKIQQVILDPEGEFSSLRERFPYLLASAGADGDVPANPKTAKVLARRLLEVNASAVIDIYELDKKDRRAFVKLFLDELMHLPRSLWRPLLTVIDEAHDFAPERGHGEAESLDSVINLCTKGRKRGFSALLATQRISKLHKDAAAELLNKLIGRTGLDVDVKRAGDELGFDKEKRLTLRDLEPGHFFAFGPAISKHVIEVKSGAITTTHPEPGKVAPPAPPAPEKVKKLVAQLQDLAAQAKQEAITLEEQAARIRELERELRQSKKAVPAGNTPAVIDDKAIARAVAAAEKPLREQVLQLQRERDASAKALKNYNDVLGKHFGKMQVLASQLHVMAENPPAPFSIEVAKPAQRTGNAFEQMASDLAGIDYTRAGPPDRAAQTLGAMRSARVNTSVNSDAARLRAQLGTTPRKMLDAMGALEQLGVTICKRSTVAGWCGISADTGTFRNYLSELRSAGVINDEANGDISLTPEGLAAAEPLDIPDLDTLHNIWFKKLGSTPAKMLRVLIKRYPGPITREQLGASIDPPISHETGTFRNYLSELRGPGLMRDVSKTEVAATCFCPCCSFEGCEHRNKPRHLKVLP